jgi:hypothetical protein
MDPFGVLLGRLILVLFCFAQHCMEGGNKDGDYVPRGSRSARIC